MEELLNKYLKSVENCETINIRHWYIDGVSCVVEYYTDDSRYYKETRDFNVWDMLIFLNTNNK